MGDEDHLFTRLAEADVAVVRLAHRFDRSLISSATNLKYIVSPTTGLNHIDLEAAEAEQIQILSLKGESEFLSNVSATAELTWALLLNLVRSVPAALDHVKGGQWNRDAFRGHELQDQTIGIVGFGRLGRIVAKYANAFGMSILAHDPYVETVPDGVSMVHLNYLLKESDVVSLHVPLNEETRNLLGREQLALMKPTTLVINTSRGEILDEVAFVEARRNRAIGGGAFDVLSSEGGPGGDWLENSPIAQLARFDSSVLITPHIGGCTFESSEKTEVFMAQKLEAALNHHA